MAARTALILLALAATVGLGAGLARAQIADAFSPPPERDASLAQDATDVSGHMDGYGCRCATDGGLGPWPELLIAAAGLGAGLLRRRGV